MNLNFLALIAVYFILSEKYKKKIMTKWRLRHRGGYIPDGWRKTGSRVSKKKKSQKKNGTTGDGNQARNVTFIDGVEKERIICYASEDIIQIKIKKIPHFFVILEAIKRLQQKVFCTRVNAYNFYYACVFE